MYDYALFKTEVGADPKWTNGLSDGGKREINASKKLLEAVGNSRFSVPAFGLFLYENIDNSDELEKIILSFVYMINEVSRENNTPVGFMAQRIMATLGQYGYVDEQAPEE